MENLPQGIRQFLVRAKQATYAAKGPEAQIPSRPSSHDLHYEEEGGWRYIDSFLGSENFAGQEAVFKDGKPVWAMNYCGHVLAKGFSPDFLKAALKRVPPNYPYRGPIEYQEGPFLYCNAVQGQMEWFFGREEIFANGVSAYECIYHGGMVK